MSGTARGPSRATAPNRPRKAVPEDAPVAAALGATLDFMRLLWATDHGLQRRSKRMAVELGVTGMQRIVIRLIGRFPQITAGGLADLVHVHPSTLTGVLKRLAERGLIARVRDPADARVARLSLTPDGSRIDGMQAGTVEAAVRRALGRLDPDHLDAARVVLSAIADELSRTDR